MENSRIITIVVIAVVVLGPIWYFYSGSGGEPAPAAETAPAATN